MKKLSQTLDFQKFQQNPRLTAIICDVENRYAKAALSDDELELVNAAGDTTVPAMYPDVLLGRHDIPADTGERKP